MESMGYTLTVIEDESVALAGSIPTGTSIKIPLLIGTSLMIVLICLTIALVAYILRLHYYRARLNELAVAGDCSIPTYNPRSIRSVRNQINLVESTLVDASFSEWN